MVGDLKALKEEGYTCGEAWAAGYSPKEARAAGYSLEEMKAAGVEGMNMAEVKVRGSVGRGCRAGIPRLTVARAEAPPLNGTAPS